MRPGVGTDPEVAPVCPGTCLRDVAASGSTAESGQEDELQAEERAPNCLFECEFLLSCYPWRMAESSEVG